MENIFNILQERSETILVAAGGILGRLIYHSGEVKMNRRKFFSKELVLEVPIALGMGFIANGVCVYFELTGEINTGAAILAGYLGPKSIDLIFDKVLEKKLEKKENEE